jgi:hypothetical protein
MILVKMLAHDLYTRLRVRALPKYLVSPDWFVTKEHIISDKFSTSCSTFSFSGCKEFLFFSSSFDGSGEVNELCGVDAVPS